MLGFGALLNTGQVPDCAATERAGWTDSGELETSLFTKVSVTKLDGNSRSAADAGRNTRRTNVGENRPVPEAESCEEKWFRDKENNSKYSRTCHFNAVPSS